jgi:hypothetical protein
LERPAISHGDVGAGWRDECLMHGFGLHVGDMRADLL